MGQSYTLFGAEFSLYSGKLRSYLRKKGIAYQETNASALEHLGIRSAFEQSPPVRLKRVENKLWFEPEKD